MSRCGQAEVTRLPKEAAELGDGAEEGEAGLTAVQTGMETSRHGLKQELAPL